MKYLFSLDKLFSCFETQKKLFTSIFKGLLMKRMHHSRRFWNVEETNEKKNVFNLDRKNIPFFCKKKQNKSFWAFLFFFEERIKAKQSSFYQNGLSKLGQKRKWLFLQRDFFLFSNLNFFFHWKNQFIFWFLACQAIVFKMPTCVNCWLGCQQIDCQMGRCFDEQMSNCSHFIWSANDWLMFHLYD